MQETGAEGLTKKWKKRARKHGPAQSLEAFTAQTLLAYVLPFTRTRDGVLDRSLGSQSEVENMSIEERKSIACTLFLEVADVVAVHDFPLEAAALLPTYPMFHASFFNNQNSLQTTSPTLPLSCHHPVVPLPCKYSVSSRLGFCLK